MVEMSEGKESMSVLFRDLDLNEKFPKLGQSCDLAMCFCCEVTSRFYRSANQEARLIISIVRGRMDVTQLLLAGVQSERKYRKEQTCFQCVVVEVVISPLLVLVDQL